MRRELPSRTRLEWSQERNADALPPLLANCFFARYRTLEISDLLKPSYDSYLAIFFR